jgi:hypothetical protein
LSFAPPEIVMSLEIRVLPLDRHGTAAQAKLLFLALELSDKVRQLRRLTRSMLIHADDFTWNLVESGIGSKFETAVVICNCGVNGEISSAKPKRVVFALEKNLCGDECGCNR